MVVTQWINCQSLFTDDGRPFHVPQRLLTVVLAPPERVEDLLKAAGVGGFHQARTIFNDQSGLVMYVGVAEPKVIADVARGLSRLFESRPGVTFLSDVEVMRSDYFAASAAPAG